MYTCVNFKNYGVGYVSLHKNTGYQKGEELKLVVPQ